MTVRVNPQGDLRNFPAQSAPTSVVSGPITGNWGITIPYVSLFYGVAPLAGYGEGWNTTAQIVMEFSEPTDRAGLGGGVLNKTVTDQLFNFDQSLGADYTGQWNSNQKFTVTAVDVTGAGPPEIGVLTVQIMATRGLMLKNVDGDSKPGQGQYRFVDGVWGLTGSFAVNTIELTSVVGDPSPTETDDVWGVGDSITIEFNQPTNKGCYQGCEDYGVPHATVMSLFSFSDSFWPQSASDLGSVTGRWTSNGSVPCQNCLSGTSGRCKAQPTLDVVSGYYTDTSARECSELVEETGECAPGYQLCSSSQIVLTKDGGRSTLIPPTIGGMRARVKVGSFIRNYPASVEPTGDVQSPYLIGAFGPPCISITSVRGSDPNGIDGRYNQGDVITVEFNQDTNLADMTFGSITQQQADSLFSYTCSGAECPQFAGNYTGTWVTRRRLTLTATNTLNIYPFDESAPETLLPIPGQFSLEIRPGNNLRNYPPACFPNFPISPALEGSFGPSNLAIDLLEVKDPLDLNDFYSDGDTIRIVFSGDTDYAGLGIGPWTKTMIDSLFDFSSPIGLDYTGLWLSRTTFLITLVTVGPDTLPIDGDPSCCDGDFSITVKSSGGLRQYPATSDATATCGGPQSCLEVVISSRIKDKLQARKPMKLHPNPHF